MSTEPEVTFVDPESLTGPAAEPEPAAPEPEPAAPEEAPEPEPEVFTAEYVAKLREESAANRIKAKRVDEANTRLVAALAQADGRLVEADMLPYSDDLLDDDGLVDPAKVHTAIGALIAARPYLATRTPTAPIPQGVRADAPAEVGLFDFIRQRT